VTLEVDHIIPVVSGGKNTEDNLITACFDCNRGKAGNELTQVSESLQDKAKRVREKEKQYLAFRALQDGIEERVQEDIIRVANIFSVRYSPYVLTENFKNGSLRKFIDTLGVNAVERAMHVTCGKILYEQKAVKYFCGICWNEIKANK
jgi:hypothetical protein